MPSYLFLFHRGTPHPAAADGDEAAKSWEAWLSEMGTSVVDRGAAVAQAQTVSLSGVEPHGGPNPASGYVIVSARGRDDAVRMAATCPIVSDGSGEIEIAELKEA